MASEIINRVANSSLCTLDLDDIYPKEEKLVLDIKDWLVEGFIVREKLFREELKKVDWSIYQDKYVALTCSSDAVLPGWTFMLVSTYLNPLAKKVVVGSLQDLERDLFNELIHALDVEAYRNRPVIVKGCSKHSIPETAYVQLIARLQKVAKSIMYGEACSSVPLFKK